jgi:hypothetical protein
MHKTFCCGLQSDVGAEWHSLKRQFTEGDIDFKCLTHRRRCCLGYTLGKKLELLIEHLPSLSFLLFHLDFIFIAVSVFSLPVTSLIKLNVGSLAEELDIL